MYWVVRVGERGGQQAAGREGGVGVCEVATLRLQLSGAFISLLSFVLFQFCDWKRKEAGQV